MKIKRYMELYEEGAITLMEVVARITDEITEENVAEIKDLPEDFIEELKAKADRAPKTEEEWEKIEIVSFNMGRRGYEVDKQHYRRSIEILRNAFRHT